MLPKSSCEKCREITREFEEVCAREMIGAHRAQFGYRSSSGKPLSKELEFQVHKAGTVSKKKVEASGAPLVPVIAPFFPAPGILRRVPPSDEGEFRPWTCAVNQNEPDQKRRIEMIHQNQAELISFRVNFNPIIFMRVLAKIAHAGAISVYGADKVRSFLPDYILGRDPNLPYVVGSKPTEFPHSGNDHLHSLVEFGIYDAGDARYLTVAIELFRYLYTGPSARGDRLPPYWIVVSEASDDLVQAVSGPGGQKDH